MAPLVALCACVSSWHERTSANVYPPTPPGQTIEVYRSLDAVLRPHERLGVVGATGDPKATWEMVVAELQEKARQLGAHAIVLQSTANAYEGTMPTLTDNFEERPGTAEGLPQFEKRATALAIRYREAADAPGSEAPAQRAAPPERAAPAAR